MEKFFFADIVKKFWTYSKKKCQFKIVLDIHNDCYNKKHLNTDHSINQC